MVLLALWGQMSMQGQSVGQIKPCDPFLPPLAGFGPWGLSCAGIGIGSDAPLWWNFQTHGEPHKQDDTVLKAGSHPWTGGWAALVYKTYVLTRTTRSSIIWYLMTTCVVEALDPFSYWFWRTANVEVIISFIKYDDKKYKEKCIVSHALSAVAFVGALFLYASST